MLLSIKLVTSNRAPEFWFFQLPWVPIIIAMGADYSFELIFDIVDWVPQFIGHNKNFLGSVCRLQHSHFAILFTILYFFFYRQSKVSYLQKVEISLHHRKSWPTVQRKEIRCPCLNHFYYAFWKRKFDGKNYFGVRCFNCSRIRFSETKLSNEDSKVTVRTSLMLRRAFVP